MCKGPVVRLCEACSGTCREVGGGEVRKIRVERCWVVVMVGFGQRNTI